MLAFELVGLENQGSSNKKAKKQQSFSPLLLRCTFPALVYARFDPYLHNLRV